MCHTLSCTQCGSHSSSALKWLNSVLLLLLLLVQVGTLRLGSRVGPGGAVVDADLKYGGLDNLSVCDLSVFPTSPAANPTLTLTALAMRLADRLK